MFYYIVPLVPSEFPTLELILKMVLFFYFETSIFAEFSIISESFLPLQDKYLAVELLFAL